MMRYTATIFNSFGTISTQKGDTPEEATQKACECHKDFRVPIGQININPHSGLIFVNGKPCGVVYLNQKQPCYNCAGCKVCMT